MNTMGLLDIPELMGSGSETREYRGYLHVVGMAWNLRLERRCGALFRIEMGADTGACAYIQATTMPLSDMIF